MHPLAGAAVAAGPEGREAAQRAAQAVGQPQRDDAVAVALLQLPGPVRAASSHRVDLTFRAESFL